MHIIGMLMRAAIAAAATSILAVPASAQSFRMATSWGGGPHLEVMAKGFASNAAQLTDGKVKFEVFPAGTIGSPLKVTETVQKKVAQAGHHWSGYDYGLDKTAVLFGGYACGYRNAFSVPKRAALVTIISVSPMMALSGV